MCIEKLEDKSPACAAASSASKVYRDNWMRGFYHKTWPQYGFDKNVGYLTKKHCNILESFGYCPAHRLSYTVRGKKISDFGPYDENKREGSGENEAKI